MQTQQARLTEMTASLNDESQRVRAEAERSRAEASQLRGQLADAQQQLAGQQDALRQTQSELEQTRRKIQQEKAAPTQPDDGALRQLEEELRQKQAQLRTQQAKVADLQTALNQERQAAKRERETVKRQQAAVVSPPAAKPEAKAEASGLAQAQTALNDKLNAYQQKSSELTAWLTGSGVERGKIDQRKQELAADARDIAALRGKVEQLQQASGDAPLQLAGGPSIEIIAPPVTLTRGLPSIQVPGGGLKELVGRISATDGLSALLVNGQPLAVDASGVFRVPVNVSGAQTQIDIAATDKKNRRANLRVNLVAASAEAADSLPPATPAGPRPKDVDFGHFYALIIGNADYKTYPVLKTPISDAKSVELVLREKYGFKTQLLVNANRHQIMTALNEISKRLTDKDNLLIYYAGHGEIDAATQSAYWLPTDAEVGNSANWISSQSITEYLSIIPARHVMVVADSCYAGALTGSGVAKLPDGMDESKREKWLKAMNSRKARTVLTSGGVKPVMDQGGGEHSIFANAFLKVLRGNSRPVLEDYDVYRDVAGQVRGASAKVGFQQSPQYAPLQHAGHEGSPFFFVPEV
ncbi:MAG: caspase family protein [Candidatus Methylumidiphilus sp.]